MKQLFEQTVRRVYYHSQALLDLRRFETFEDFLAFLNAFLDHIQSALDPVALLQLMKKYNKSLKWNPEKTRRFSEHISDEVWGFVGFVREENHYFVYRWFSQYFMQRMGNMDAFNIEWSKNKGSVSNFVNQCLTFLERTIVAKLCSFENPEGLDYIEPCLLKWFKEMRVLFATCARQCWVDYERKTASQFSVLKTHQKYAIDDDGGGAYELGTPAPEDFMKIMMYFDACCPDVVQRIGRENLETQLRGRTWGRYLGNGSAWIPLNADEHTFVDEKGYHNWNEQFGKLAETGDLLLGNGRHRQPGHVMSKKHTTFLQTQKRKHNGEEEETCGASKKRKPSVVIDLTGDDDGEV